MYRHSNIISNSPVEFIREEGINIGSSTTGKSLFLCLGRLERHLLVIGKTGSGKSNFLKVLIKGIISADMGSVFLLDPHGNLARDMACSLPENSIVLSPNCSITEGQRYALSLNAISNGNSGEERNLAAGWIKDAFASEGIFSHGTWGPRLEVVFTSILHELLRKESESNLADLLNLLLDGGNTRKFISSTESEELKAFLKMQVSDWRGWNQYVTSSVNKLLPLLTEPGIRHLISGRQDSFDLLGLFIGHSSIIIPEIWRDAVPDDSFKIIGMLLILKLWLQRIVHYDPHKDKPIYMVFDEAQLVPGSILDRLLREGRKWGFRVILATQFLGRGLESLSETIRGNVGNVVSFNLFEEDAVEISSNFFTGNLGKKLQDVLKTQPVHSAVIWSQDEKGISGPLSFKPIVEVSAQDADLFQALKENSMAKLGTALEGREEESGETDLHEYLILRFQEFLLKKGIESDRHRSFHGIYPDLYFEHKDRIVFVEVEVSDLVNMGRVAEKIVNYAGKALIFITPPGASVSLFERILRYIGDNGVKIFDKMDKANRDMLSGISILEYDNGFTFLSAGRLRKLRMEHLSYGSFARTLVELPLGEIRSYMYNQMVKEGMSRIEFPREKIEKVFGKANSEKAFVKFSGNSSLVSMHDLFTV
ncbi:MAG: DUF87 domain-containing protein [Candidatus Thermoplasmatota archaeon]|nr:DUF87 domain-containing protein [Candidatus Thermoplasmatota archaeon]